MVDVQKGINLLQTYFESCSTLFIFLLGLFNQYRLLFIFSKYMCVFRCMRSSGLSRLTVDRCKNVRVGYFC